MIYGSRLIFVYILEIFGWYQSLQVEHAPLHQTPRKGTTRGHLELALEMKQPSFVEAVNAATRAVKKTVIEETSQLSTEWQALPK